MKPLPAPNRLSQLAVVAIGLTIWLAPSLAHSGDADSVAKEVRIVELRGTVEIRIVGATRWTLTQTNETLRQHDLLRTGSDGSAGLLVRDRGVVRFGPNTMIEVLPPDA